MMKSMRQLNILLFFLLLVASSANGQKRTYERAGNAFSKQSNYKKSLRLYQKILDKNAIDAYALNGKGLSLYYLERYDEALQCVKMAILFNSKEMSFYISRSKCHSALLEYDRAMKDLDYVIEAEPRRSAAYYNRAILLFTQNKSKEAIHDFDEAIALGENDAHIYFSRAAAYANLDEFQLAVNDYEKSLEIDPSSAEVHYYYAILLQFSMNRTEDAIEHFSKALELGFQEDQVYLSLGHLYANSMQYSLAEMNYTKSIEQNPDSASTFFSRGTIRYFLQDYDGALDDFNHTLELNPKSIGALTNRALYVYDVSGEFDLAIADIRKVMEINEEEGLNMAHSYNNLGYMLYRKNLYTEAMSNIEYSLELDDTNSYAYRNLALVYLALKQVELACISATKSIELGFIESYGSEIVEIKNKACP